MIRVAYREPRVMTLYCWSGAIVLTAFDGLRPKGPAPIDEKVPEEDDDRGDQLCRQVVHLDQVDSDMHQACIQACTRAGHHKKPGHALEMTPITCKRVVVVQPVVDPRPNS